MTPARAPRAGAPAGEAARLRASYAACDRLAARYGRSYHLATRLLPAAKRPAVHALYAFARAADEIVDSAPPGTDRAGRLRAFGDALLAGGVGGPLLPAVQDTVTRWEIPRRHFTDFLAAMAMDLAVTSYPGYADLLGYMHGSAAAIGLQMLPILEPVPGMAAVAAGYARDLGIAFQLTNFIRDVGEDLRRGRLYLPVEDLEAFGVTREQLAAGVVDGRVRRLLAHEVARTREVFRAAAPGVRLLHPTSRECIRTALRLYAGILDEVEDAGYRVLDRRVAVGPLTRVRWAVPALVRARRVERRVRACAGPTRPTSTASG